ncbi:MAG: Sua5/YciO/YrdC/YwlC family protein, partial [Bacteroidota bacterium]
LQVKDRNSRPFLAKNLNSGLNLLGIMLPYMPFHYQLFGKLKTKALVLTSGNFSSEPIIIDNAEALEKFSPFTDAVLLHNRDIFNRTDDSVVRIIGGKERIFRRSRGYVPSSVRMQLYTEGIIAFGAELSNCFCVGKGSKAFLSQHIGDLKGLETTLFYEQTLERFVRMFRLRPALLAADMHPDYISTTTAEGFGTPDLIRIQHHHAHIASCMAENRLDEKVIGVAFDGTGYGDDGHTWGSEFMVCDLEGYSRKSHLAYLPLPGGDSASEDPWRIAVSWLYKVYGREFMQLDLPLLRQAKAENILMLLKMIDRKVNCPLTCGAGRYFDAVASILGLCQVAEFPAQGPMLLEARVEAGCDESYEWSGFHEISVDAALKGIAGDVARGADQSIIISKFHNTISSIIFETVKRISVAEGLKKVVISGGVFQNKYLLERTEGLLRGSGFEVYTHAAVPTNDGGIALGQLAVAAKRRELCV